MKRGKMITKSQMIKEVEDALDGKPKKLTPAQIELGANYLAMSNICTLDQYRRDIKDLTSMRQAVNRAWETAVQGYMEGQEGGYDDKYESQAIREVEQEVKGFRADLKAGGDRSRCLLEMMMKEVPFFFTDPSLTKVIKVTARKHEGDDLYSWAIFRSDKADPCYTGLGKSEVPYYKKLVEKIIERESR
jgi:hypothetical protein